MFVHIFMSIKKDVQFANLKLWGDIQCWVNNSVFLCIFIWILKSHERIVGCYIQACGSGSETDLYRIKTTCEADNTLMQVFVHSKPVGFVFSWKHWNYKSVQRGYGLRGFRGLSNPTWHWV